MDIGHEDDGHHIDNENAIHHPPDDLKCSQTHQLFKDPVIISSGRTYERDAIDLWLQNNSTDPCTKEELVIKELRIPNHDKRAQVAKWMETVAGHKHGNAPHHSEPKPAVFGPTEEDVHSKLGDDEANPSLKCPISYMYMRDPVILTYTSPDGKDYTGGHTYEKVEIMKSLEHNPHRDPTGSTRISPGTSKLTPNWNIRKIIQDLLDRHPNFIPDGWNTNKMAKPYLPKSLIDCVKNADINIIDDYLELYPDELNKPDYDGTTPIGKAIYDFIYFDSIERKRISKQIFDFLIQKGADVSILHKGKSLVKLCVENVTSPSRVLVRTKAMMQLVKEMQEEMLRTLIERNAITTHIDSTNMPALQLTVLNQDFHLSDLLYDTIDFDIIGAWGAYDAARCLGQAIVECVAQPMSEKGVKFTKKLVTKLINNWASDNFSDLPRGNIDHLQNMYYGAIAQSCKNGYLEMAQYLINEYLIKEYKDAGYYWSKERRVRDLLLRCLLKTIMEMCCGTCQLDVNIESDEYVMRTAYLINKYKELIKDNPGDESEYGSLQLLDFIMGFSFRYIAFSVPESGLMNMLLDNLGNFRIFHCTANPELPTSLRHLWGYASVFDRAKEFSDGFELRLRLIDHSTLYGCIRSGKIEVASRLLFDYYLPNKVPYEDAAYCLLAIEDTFNVPGRKLVKTIIEHASFKFDEMMDQHTLLTKAVDSSLDTTCVKMLIDKLVNSEPDKQKVAACLNKLDNRNKSPLDSCQSPTIAEHLLKNGARPRKLIKKEDTNSILLAITKPLGLFLVNTMINATDPDDSEMGQYLMRALRRGKVLIAELLLERGARLENIKDFAWFFSKMKNLPPPKFIYKMFILHEEQFHGVPPPMIYMDNSEQKFKSGTILHYLIHNMELIKGFEDKTINFWCKYIEVSKTCTLRIDGKEKKLSLLELACECIGKNFEVAEKVVNALIENGACVLPKKSDIQPVRVAAYNYMKAFTLNPPNICVITKLLDHIKTVRNRDKEQYFDMAFAAEVSSGENSLLLDALAHDVLHDEKRLTLSVNLLHGYYKYMANSIRDCLMSRRKSSLNCRRYWINQIDQCLSISCSWVAKEIMDVIIGDWGSNKKIIFKKAIKASIINCDKDMFNFLMDSNNDWDDFKDDDILKTCIDEIANRCKPDESNMLMQTFLPRILDVIKTFPANALHAIFGEKKENPAIQLNIQKILLKEIDVDIDSKMGNRTILFEHIRRPESELDIQCIETILHHGAKIDILCGDGIWYDSIQLQTTPLHLAVKRCVKKTDNYKSNLPLKALKTLLKSKVPFDINVLNGNGNTPLHFAQNVPVAQLLLKAGANPTIKNKAGHTPSQFWGNVGEEFSEDCCLESLHHSRHKPRLKNIKETQDYLKKEEERYQNKEAEEVVVAKRNKRKRAHTASADIPEKKRRSADNDDDNNGDDTSPASPEVESSGESQGDGLGSDSDDSDIDLDIDIDIDLDDDDDDDDLDDDDDDDDDIIDIDIDDIEL